jgi:uncharacterized protein YhfF
MHRRNNKVMTNAQRYFLECYLSTLDEPTRALIPQINAEHFCADEWNANACAALINAGTKTSSCSLKACYAIEQEPEPVVGQLTVVLDWQQQPVCIIKVIRIEYCQFKDVTPEFAAQEGEGDRSYASWRSSHQAFFTQDVHQLGISFDEESELILEYFTKVFPES